MNPVIPQIGRLVNWYGSNAKCAKHVGVAMAGCRFVCIPFAGGLSEVPHINAREMVINDQHRHLINLARTVADKSLMPLLIARLADLVYHPQELAEAQMFCAAGGFDLTDPMQLRQLPADQRVEWAAAYFACAWMTRSGSAGTGEELKRKLSVRMDAEGGGCGVRWVSVVSKLHQWHDVLKAGKVFVCQDGFDLIGKQKDVAWHGIYCDPPFPGGAGDRYMHAFDGDQHRSLPEALEAFDKNRVVVRLYDTREARGLYPADKGWVWLSIAGGKDQHRKDKAECLVCRNLPQGIQDTFTKEVTP